MRTPEGQLHSAAHGTRYVILPVYYTSWIIYIPSTNDIHARASADLPRFQIAQLQRFQLGDRLTQIFTTGYAFENFSSHVMTSENHLKLSAEVTQTLTPGCDTNGDFCIVESLQVLRTHSSSSFRGTIVMLRHGLTLLNRRGKSVLRADEDAVFSGFRYMVEF